ncbi:hypothetical protein A5727_16670 [Mycobacterium sp. ACS4331]|nr:hypothetical protein A5727_16670 [Mycobacterium sp. ACS4331]
MSDPDMLATVSRGLGEAMDGVNVEDIAATYRLAERGSQPGQLPVGVEPTALSSYCAYNQRRVATKGRIGRVCRTDDQGVGEDERHTDRTGRA